jgi:hypothetical protein
MRNQFTRNCGWCSAPIWCLVWFVLAKRKFVLV